MSDNLATPVLDQLKARLARLREHKDAKRELPLVSVCIAAYNHEAYVAQAIESVLAQSYPNIEILVADDASPDGTAAIVREFAQRHPSRVRALLLGKNEGPSRISNRLFAMAQGELVAFLGSDDRMLPQRIERQVEHMRSNPGCVAVFSEIAVIDAQGRRVESDGERFFNQPIIHLRRQLLGGNFLNAPSAMVRRSDLIAVGGYDPLLRYVQDLELWGRLLGRGEIARIQECLTEYRVHGANLSIFGQKGPNLSARSETAETIIGFVRQWPLESLLLRQPENDQERASALLELAGVLQLVDRKFFNKPSLGSAQAYQMILQAGRLHPALAQIAKEHIEHSLESGFDAQWKPCAWQDGSVPAWFAEPREALGDSSGSRHDLGRWLGNRVPTVVQRTLIDDYIQSHSGGPVIAVVIVDLAGDTKALAETIKSLGAEDNWYASVSILVLSVGPVPKTQRGGKLHMLQVDAQSYISTLNAELREMDFAWVMVAQAGEVFTPSGLLIAGLELISATSCVAVYGDELQRLPNGTLGAAFRPSFNLDLLLSFPVGMARHWLFRRDVLLQLGGFDDRYAEAMEFRLILQLIESQGLGGIGHIDEPLLITNASALRDCPDEQSAIRRHLEVRGYSTARLLPHLPGRYRIDYGFRDKPLISIIVPTKDQLPILQRCIESLLEKTAYANYELLIVDNNSETPEALAWFAGVEAMGDSKVRILRYPHPFNYSAINNMAAREARGEYLVLLNNDTAIISERWLDELLNHAQRPEVGIVGAKLLYPDGRIQHAGVVLGLRGPADHPFIGEPMDAAGYMQRLQVDQNYSAVTAACLMIRKSIYEEVGGLEEGFKVSYNDVDLCLKVREAGHLIVWTPHAVVMHEGSVSQKRIDPKAAEAKRQRFIGEQDAMYEKWLPALANDPAYNRNLSLNGRGFELETDLNLTWRPLTWRPLPVVLAHPADPWGCGNYRVIRPLRAMRRDGLVDGMLSDGLLQVVDLERYSPDVIVLQRQIGDERLEAMRRIQRLSRAFTVYELDDYLPNLPMKSLHREHMPKDILKSLRRGLSFVDRFVVSTEPLAEAFAGLHDDIRVIENRLPVEWWKDLSSQRRRGRKPRVGWAGGVSHTGDLELITDVVKELAAEVEWVFFGMCPEVIRPYVHEVHEGVEIDLYPAALARLDLDLALAPIEQNLFNECKSNLRLLEYGACGFPVVCSDLRPYQGNLPVTRVKNRFKDWVDAIRMHINDLDATAKMGDELRAKVLSDWMLEGDNLLRWREAWSPN